MMRIKFIRNICLLCGMLLLVACQHEYSLQTEGSASLHVTIKGVESSLISRGVEDLDDNGTITEEETMVDGRKMYRLALFLLDGNTVVGHEVLEYKTTSVSALYDFETDVYLTDMENLNQVSPTDG